MYQALVFIHLLGVIVFALAHGVSIFAAFRVRREDDAAVVAALLGMSKTAVIAVYVGLLLIGVGGLGAAATAGLLTAPWIVASYVIVVIVIAAMYAVATPYYVGVRKLVDPTTREALDPTVLRRTLDTRRPEILILVGSVGGLLLLWLMVYKPG